MGLKFEVRLFATFRDGRGKKVYVEMPHPTPRKILSSIGIEAEDVAILLVNGQDASFDMEMKAGDYISVFPPVGGG